MAAVSIYSPAQVPVTVPAQDKTYLQICTDDMNPSSANSAWWESTMKKTAAYGTLVLYTIAAAGAAVAAYVFAPAFFAGAAVGAVVLGNLVHDFAFAKLKGQSDHAAFRYEQLSQTQKHYQALTQKTPIEQRQALLNMGLTAVPNAAPVLPLIARDLYLQDYAKSIEAQKQSRLDEAQKLSQENFVRNRDDINQLVKQSLDCDLAIQTAKMKQAFARAAIQRPSIKGSLDNVGSFSCLNPEERLTGNAVGDATANNFFVFHRNVRPLTLDEVKRTPVNALSQRLLQEIPA